MAWVYIAQAPSGATKIGKTERTPDERIAELSFADEKARFVATRFYSDPATAAEIEAAFLKAFKPFRLHGEWFAPSAAIASLAAEWGGTLDQDTHLYISEPTAIRPIHVPNVTGETGAKRLRSWVEGAGVNQTQLAKLLRVTPCAVSLLLNEKRLPGVGMAFDIDRLTGGAIPARIWSDRADDHAALAAEEVSA